MVHKGKATTTAAWTARVCSSYLTRSRHLEKAACTSGNSSYCGAQQMGQYTLVEKFSPEASSIFVAKHSVRTFSISAIASSWFLQYVAYTNFNSSEMSTKHFPAVQENKQVFNESYGVVLDCTVSNDEYRIACGSVWRGARNCDVLRFGVVWFWLEGVNLVYVEVWYGMIYTSS